MKLTDPTATTTPTINPVLFFFEGGIDGIPLTLGVKSEQSKSVINCDLET